MPYGDPTVNFDIDQKVLVFVPKSMTPIDYLPCIPFERNSTITKVPHLSWIKYRGLARFYGELYLRFIYEEEQIYISLSCLPYLEDIPQRNPFKIRRSRPSKKIVPGIKPRSLKYQKKLNAKRKKLRHINQSQIT